MKKTEGSNMTFEFKPSKMQLILDGFLCKYPLSKLKVRIADGTKTPIYL